MKTLDRFPKPAGRIASVLGALVLLMLCADVFAGPSEGVLADSALAMFLLGLAIGVPAGIGLFFAYLVIRERRHAEEPDELDALFEAMEAENDPWSTPAESSFSSNQEFGFPEAEEEPIESSDPWERPADWWRQGDN